MVHATKLFISGLLMAILMPATAAAQSGKIAGSVSDAETGDPLPGVNVVIEDLNQGSATDQEGDYFIINVPPGTYNVQASFVGYREVVKENVQVSTDRTATVDFELIPETVEVGEVVVTADQDVVRKDVANTQIRITPREATETPSVQNLNELAMLQPGIEMGGGMTSMEQLQVRGGHVEETQFRIDGQTSTDRRRNNSLNNMVSMTSIKEVQIQTGGFDAEYGNARSGVINVVTKNGLHQQGLDFDGFVKYEPPHLKTWGKPYEYDDPRDVLYPYLGPESMDGFVWPTKEHLPEATDEQLENVQSEYFKGWKEYTSNLPEDHPFHNDPESAREKFAWFHRPQPMGTMPDVNADLTLSGSLTDDMGFSLSTVLEQEDPPFPTPVGADWEVHTDWSVLGQLAYRPTSSLRLNVQGQVGRLQSFTNSRATPSENQPGNYYQNELWIRGWDENNSVFNNGGHTLVWHNRKRLGLEATQTFSNRTFLRVNAQYFQNDYRMKLGPQRDTSTVQKVIETKNGQTVELDETPFGYIGGQKFKDMLGNYVGGWAVSRDRSSNTTAYGKAVLVSQIDKYNQLKAGFEYEYNNIRERKGILRWEKSRKGRHWYEERPVYMGAFVNDKVEWEGLVTNVGVRLDYSDPTDSYYTWSPEDAYRVEYGGQLKYEEDYPWEHGASYDENSFIDWLEDNAVDPLEDMPRKDVEPKFTLSPRLGVSHPITDNSKLFFNYGHFYQVPNYQDMFMVSYPFGVNASPLGRIGNPWADFPKTVSYEIGWEQNITGAFQLRTAGYYKDITNELTEVSYYGATGVVGYSRPENKSYRDIRGVEVSLRRTAGRFVTGYVGYDYRIQSSGRVGEQRIYEDPTRAPRYYNPNQIKPVATPRLNAVVNFSTPRQDWGPAIAGFHPFSFVRVNVLFRWKAGDHFTYNPDNKPGVQNNMQFIDFRKTDLRISKGINIGSQETSMRLFVEVENLFNRRNLRYQPWRASLKGEWPQYLASLKPGDRVGDFDMHEKPYLDVPRKQMWLASNSPRVIGFGARIGF
jgi:hypothetical protein